ncbi:hypothetical protein [Sciscionella sediminilitoris]|uniref:hypothetical protein n=1 Tax=Sciscionella sediminilitoris TaxID=1445613 RepID=UPI0004DF0D60|nr:hypothetical protein [Sciscionella sp. SE31]
MNDTLMWEVRASEGNRDALLAWVRDTGLPAVTASPGFLDARIYLGGQDRVVVIAHWSGEPVRLPDPPQEWLARPIAQWPFQRYS